MPVQIAAASSSAASSSGRAAGAAGSYELQLRSFDDWESWAATTFPLLAPGPAATALLPQVVQMTAVAAGNEATVHEAGPVQLTSVAPAVLQDEVVAENGTIYVVERLNESDWEC